MASSNANGPKAVARGDNRVAPSTEQKPDKKKNLILLDMDHKKQQEKQKKKTPGLHDKPADKPANKPRSFFWRRVSKKHENGHDEEYLAVIARDIAQTSCETWVTFAFTFIVGAFLLGGGIYLIYNGATNNVVDFVVLGGCGVFMGICFSSVGSYLIFKPVYDTYKDRKKRQEEYRQQLELEKSRMRPQQSYLTEDEAQRMTLELGNQSLNRRPSNSELYGNDTTAVKTTEPRINSTSSYDPPPPLAVPLNSENADSRDKPVVLMDVRSTTDDDIFAISEAAEKKNVASGPKQTVITKKSEESTPTNDTLLLSQFMASAANQESDTSKLDTKEHTPMIVEVSRESTNVEIHEPPTNSGSRASSAHSAIIHHGLDSLDDSPLPVVESPTDEELDASSRKNTFYLDSGSGSRTDTGFGESVSDEDLPIKKKRVLSAVNERRSARNRDRIPAEDPDETIQIE